MSANRSAADALIGGRIVARTKLQYESKYGLSRSSTKSSWTLPAAAGSLSLWIETTSWRSSVG
jgi:hypothetical protein